MFVLLQRGLWFQCEERGVALWAVQYAMKALSIGWTVTITFAFVTYMSWCVLHSDWLRCVFLALSNVFFVALYSVFLFVKECFHV